MKIFKDTQGREWEIAVNVATIKRVRSLLDVDLMSLVDEQSNLIQRLQTDPVLLVDVVYVLCKPQADQRGVTDEQFGESMASDALDDATSALFRELADFFPKGRRALMQKMVDKIEKFQKRAIEYADARLESGELDRQFEQLLQTHGGSSGDAQESLDSTPDP